MNTNPFPTSEVLLARQPIFDRNMSLYGYELLYRQQDSLEHANFLCGDTATSLLLLNNYASLPQSTEHHRVPAFINITENLIKSSDLLPVAPEKVVLEVLESVTPDHDLIEAIKRYKSLGFKIALDDYPFTEDFEKLLFLADFIKVDVMNTNLDEVQHKINHMKNFNAQLLAEKVEDHDCYVDCLKLGFHLFQGYFFEKPQIIRGKKLSANKQSVMQLMATLYDPKSEPAAIAQKIAQDAELSYRLLRIINSAAYGLTRKINSVKDAVVLLGLQKLKRWISLLALSSSDDTPPELIKTLLIRGRSCELLAEKLQAGEQEQYFTTGLFSGIDSLLGADLDYLINELPLVNEIKEAILQYQGPQGMVLKAVIQFEHAQWESLNTQIDEQLINQCYFESIGWCEEVSSTLN